MSPPNLTPLTLHQELLQLDFYLSLTCKINTLAQVGAHVSHQERAALPSPAFCCMSVCLCVCVSVGSIFLSPHAGSRWVPLSCKGPPNSQVQWDRRVIFAQLLG
jgi:hypothetical protein